MYTLEQYRSASLEAQLNVRYAHERLRDMSSAGKISGQLFRARQDYLARCIDDWRALSEGLLTRVQWRQPQTQSVAPCPGDTWAPRLVSREAADVHSPPAS
jgi:hypothetical protein